jgi:hypothetical protein
MRAAGIDAGSDPADAADVPGDTQTSTPTTSPTPTPTLTATASPPLTPTSTSIVMSSPSFTPTSTVPPASCVGDCNGDREVVVNELVLGTNIALEKRSLAECPSFDENGSLQVEVNELLLAVANALGACPAR